MLIALADGEKYAQEIADFMHHATQGSLSVKEQSLYRALRRFDSLNLLNSRQLPSPENGPNRKYYSLNSTGKAVLAQFTKRNITPLQSRQVITILTRIQEEQS
jgi:DNA-binding PadR family transcriptional regulator